MSNGEVAAVASGESLDDYLVSIASGLADARVRLAAEPAATLPGQPAVTYQIPRLDFELKLQVSVESRPVTAAPVGEGRFRRVVVAPPTGRTQSEAASTIRGSFVAVPVEGGVPRPVLELSVRETEEDDRVGVSVRVRDVSGDAVEGVEVELNVDRELSAALNGRELAAATGLGAGVVSTDVDGVASTTLLIASDEPADTGIVVVGEIGTTRDTLLYRT